MRPLPHRPPRLEHEPGAAYALFLSYLRVAEWERPYEALGYDYAMTPAAIATTAGRYHWDIRYQTWYDTR